LQRNRICIVGAGPAGATAALFLAQKGIPSTLIDKSSFPRDKVCGDACSGKVSWVLRKLNIDKSLAFQNKHIHLPSWGVKFFGSQNNELKVPFKINYNAIKDIAPGFISKRIDFDNQLIEWVRTEPLIQFIENCPLNKFSRVDTIIRLENSKTSFSLDADVVLAADGAYSSIAKQLMQVSIPDNKNSLGLRAYFEGVQDLDADGFIELHFLKELLPGYFWIFPLANGHANVGLGIRTDIQKDRRMNLKDTFDEIIQNHPVLSLRFKNAKLMGDVKLHGLPLGGHAQISDKQLLLLGDAAALIDPFTGEGIGNAMISGMYAADVIAQNYENGNFQAQDLKTYNQLVYKRLGSELQLSQHMQNLTKYPTLFNFVVNKARKNKELRETISCMFESVDLRKKLRNPLFYLRILWN
jgi:geranylgeranyl reductase family protein